MTIALLVKAQRNKTLTARWLNSDGSANGDPVDLTAGDVADNLYTGNLPVPADGTYSVGIFWHGAMLAAQTATILDGMLLGDLNGFTANDRTQLRDLHSRRLAYGGVVYRHVSSTTRDGVPFTSLRVRNTASGWGQDLLPLDAEITTNEGNRHTVTFRQITTSNGWFEVSEVIPAPVSPATGTNAMMHLTVYREDVVDANILQVNGEVVSGPSALRGMTEDQETALNAINTKTDALETRDQANSARDELSSALATARDHARAANVQSKKK